MKAGLIMSHVAVDRVLKDDQTGYWLVRGFAHIGHWSLLFNTLYVFALPIDDLASTMYLQIDCTFG